MLGPAEAGLLLTMAMATLAIALVAFFFPRVLAWPLALLAAWLGTAWGVKAWKLWRPSRRRGRSTTSAVGEMDTEPPAAERVAERGSDRV
ncbi:MAG: hypothetical protein ABI777_03725 [Betaproteobacteria bacterium]